MEILENVLSIEKIKYLKELGVNTGNASMTWMLYNPNNITQYSESLSRFKVCIGKKVMYFD